MGKGRLGICLLFRVDLEIHTSIFGAGLENIFLWRISVKAISMPITVLDFGFMSMDISVELIFL